MSTKIITNETLLASLDQRVPRYELFSKSNDWSNVINATSQTLVLKQLESIAKTNNFYSRSILKAYMQLIEDTGGEICEEMYEFYCSDLILQAVENGPNKPDTLKYWVGGLDTEKSKSPNENDVVVVKEKQRVISGNNTTGHRTWEAALYLSNYLNDGHFDLRGKTILELGAGTGLMGIALAKKYSSQFGALTRVILTDGSADVVSKLDETLSLNHITNVDSRETSTSIEKHQLLWGKDELDQNPQKSYLLAETDILVGADITYDSRILPLLCETIREFFNHKTQAAIIAATVRNDQTISEWHACLDEWFPNSWEVHHAVRRPEDLEFNCWFNKGTPEIKVYYIAKDGQIFS